MGGHYSYLHNGLHNRFLETYLVVLGSVTFHHTFQMYPLPMASRHACANPAAILTLQWANGAHQLLTIDLHPVYLLHHSKAPRFSF